MANTQQETFSTEELKEGLILPFDKPYGWTSFALVKKVRYTLCKYSGIKKLKVGHAGTLDPLATGLLVLCAGKATKKIMDIQELEKVYLADIHFGATTPSYDRETQVDNTFPVEHLNEEYLTKILKNFVGKIQQVPPLFSAKNVDGVRAYKLARRGIEKELPPNEVEIHALELVRFKDNILRVKIRCSKGTYIRSLARDFGEAANSGAFLTDLRRTAIGDITIDSAYELDKFLTNLNFL